MSNEYRDAERQRQIEERRVIYVGKIAEGSTRADLRRRFEIFGPVIDISLHFRERGYISPLFFFVLPILGIVHILRKL